MTTYTADDFKRAEFAVRDNTYSARHAMRCNAESPTPWQGQYGAWRDDQMANDGWAPVQEAEDGRAGSDFWCERWAEAANQRDDAQAYAALWKETARRAVQDERRAARTVEAVARTSDRIADQRDAAERRAEKAEQERGQWRDAAQARMGQRAEQCRPLTADDITDEMVERAWDFLTGVGETWSHHEVLALLRAALTEPPSRPEGAEKIEAYMRELVTSHPEDHYGELADHLASRGVLPPLTDKTETRRDVRATEEER